MYVELYHVEILDWMVIEMKKPETFRRRAFEIRVARERYADKKGKIAILNKRVQSSYLGFGLR